MQAGTRVNAEQASKQLMRKPTRLFSGEGRRPVGEMSDSAQGIPPGYWRWHAWIREPTGTREAPAVPERVWQPTAREGQVGSFGVAERPVVVRKPGNAGGAKGP